MTRASFCSGQRTRSARARHFTESVTALAALAMLAGVLGPGGPQRAAAAPPASQTSATAAASAPAGDVGFDELPNLLAIEPADGALDAAIDGAIRLTFDAPIAPEGLSDLNVDLEEHGVQTVVGRLSVAGAVVTFTPIRSLLLDHDYTVRVAALVAGSGWIELGDASFRTRDGIWSNPQALVNAGANSPELAIDANGDALVLWEAGTSQGARLKGAYFESGTRAWQAFSPTASGGPAARPTHVAAGADGLFALTWVDGPATLGALYQLGDSDLLAGYSRLGPARVASDATDALWAGGRALVATNDADSILDVYHTEGDRFWPGAKAIAISDDGSRFHGPVLLSDGTSSARALWMQSAGAGGTRIPLTVSAATLFYSGDWSEPEVLARLDASSGVSSLTGEGSESGLLLLVWEHSSASGSRLGLLILDGEGNANASRPDSIDTLGNAYRPCVALSAAGDAAVTWVSSSGGAGDINAPAAAWGAFLAAGDSAWSAPLRLSTAGARARPPALALAADGTGHAAWVEIDAAGATRLMTSRFSPDTGFAAPSELAPGSVTAAPAYAKSLATDVDNGPRLAVGPQGRALAVWASSTGGIWSASHE